MRRALNCLQGLTLGGHFGFIKPTTIQGFRCAAGAADRCFEQSQLYPAIMVAISSTSEHIGMNEVTRISNAISQGDPQVAEQLLPLV